MIYAKTFVREFRSGSSLPLLVQADDDQRYVVKPHGSGDGHLATLVDWIALRLGADLGLPVAEPHIITIEPGFEQQAKDPEVSELIVRSHGENLATRFVESTPVVKSEVLKRLTEEMRNALFLYDLFLLNIDRSTANPNALQTQSGLVCLDFAASMAIRYSILGLNTPAHAFLARIRENPLYRPHVDPGPFALRLREGVASLRGIVADIPNEWLHIVQNVDENADRREVLLKRLETLLLTDVLDERLQALSTIGVESESERTARYAKNKQDFQDRHGGLS